MPRSQKLTKKRKYHGNRYDKIKTNLRTPDLILPTTKEEIPIENEEPCPVSSSKKKIDFKNYEQVKANSSGYCIFDLDILNNIIETFLKCKHCNANDSVSLSMTEKKGDGLAKNILIMCHNCNKSVEFMTSSKCSVELSSKIEIQKYDINLRYVYAMRTIGKGVLASKVFCSVMDLPAPPTKIKCYTNIIESAVKVCAEDSMIRATEEAVVDNDGCRELSVALDGSWQKRGYSSQNGFVSVTSIDTGKVLDVSVLSKYCYVCTSEKFSGEHECSKNYEGYSGGMELTGAVEVFRRSVERNVKYINYLGDGDSKGFHSVIEDKPYGDEMEIKKLECVGHVQKRMGSRLRRLKRDMKGKLLPDGKSIGGKNRLTDGEIDKLQVYYGNAIRSSGNDLQKMIRSVWATYFHKASSDENPQHYLCPPGDTSWCKFNKAKAEGSTYQHGTTLSEDILKLIKPIYRDLARPELLKKCLHGLTQNPNESFNNIVWTKISKNVFVTIRTLSVGVYDDVLSFNDGYYSKLTILKKLNLKFSEQLVKSLHALDSIRVRKAEYALKELIKEKRKKKRQVKRKLQPDEEPDYGPGQF